MIGMKKIFSGLKFDLCEKIYGFIMDNNIEEGDRLPSERELCKTFDVSRTALREAISILSSENVVHPYQGKGTIISKKKYEIKLLHNQCFSNAAMASGLPFKIENLDVSLEKSDRYISKFFGLNIKSNINCITNLIYVLNDPVAVEKIYYLQKKAGSISYRREKLIISTEDNPYINQLFGNNYLFFERINGKIKEDPYIVIYSFIDSTKIKFIKEYYTT